MCDCLRSIRSQSSCTRTTHVHILFYVLCVSINACAINKKKTSMYCSRQHLYKYPNKLIHKNQKKKKKRTEVMFTSFQTDSVMFLIHFFLSSLIFCFPISLGIIGQFLFVWIFFFSFPFRVHSVIHVVCTHCTHSHTNTSTAINKRTLKQKKKQKSDWTSILRTCAFSIQPRQFFFAFAAPTGGIAPAEWVLR